MTARHEGRERRTVSVARSPFTVGQVVAGILGLILVIVGGVAMARVGFSSLTGETATVLGVDHTLALGIINVVVGLMFLAAASTAAGVRGTLLSMGILAVAFGAIVMIEPSPFVDFLGDGRPVGVLYLLIGLISLLSGFFSPTYVSSQSTYDEEVDDTHFHR